MANSRASTFRNPLNVLPDWMLNVQRDKFGPAQLPIMRTQELSMQETIGLDFQDFGPLFREKPLLDGAVDVLPGNSPKQYPAPGLSPGLVNSSLKFSSHDYIVSDKKAQMQTAKGQAPKPQKTVDMFVWEQIEDELNRRRLSTSWLWRELKSSRQVIYGWKKRGIPEERLKEIAPLFGWSVERLTTGQEPQAVAPVAAPVVPLAAPARGGEPQFSPMAMELAAMFDNIPDAQQRRMTYALMVQLLIVSNPPSSAGTPSPGALQTPSLARSR